MYEQNPNMQDESIINDNITTQNAFSGKRLCPFELETLINTGILGLSNHRKTHHKCILWKTFPPLESETLINTGVSELSNHREINDTEFAKTIDHICQKCYNFYVYRQTWR